MDRKISSVFGITIVVIVAGVVGLLVLLTNSDIKDASNNPQAVPVAKKIAKQDSPQSQAVQTKEGECRERFFEGESKIHAWMAETASAAGTEQEVVLNITENDINEMPTPVADATKVNGGEKFVVKMIDAPATTKSKLKSATPDAPEVITIKGLKVDCNSLPVVSIAPGSEAFKRS